jgi:ATP-binding protein involved in chromosome partitioning
MADKSSVCESCAKKHEGCEEDCLKPLFAARQDIKSVVAVMSGKGGVGKSTVTSLLAVLMARKGHRVGILDADITGPSIPKLFGLKGGAVHTGPQGMEPAVTGLGIRVMSLNLVVEQEDEATIWRGPMLVGAAKQFWDDVNWGPLDFLFVDLPPGTGDVPLSILQGLPLKGIIVVLSPQELAVMIVKKAIRMARLLGVPIIGLVENMAYLECTGCGEVLYPFGKPKGQQVSEETGVPLLATLPVQSQITGLGDEGKIETLNSGALSGIVTQLESL